MQKEKSPLKTAVVGLGPVGLILAAHLSEAGADVSVCDVDKVKVNLIRQEGIKLTNAIEKEIKVKQVYSNLEELVENKPDIIFFALKSYQSEQLIRASASLFRDPGILLVSAQNGIDVEKMFALAFGDARVMRVIINFAGNLSAPNVVKVTFFNPPNYIASLDDSHITESEMIAEMLSGVKLETQPVNSFEILRRIWEKTILNASLSALCGIGKLTIAEAMAMPDTVEIIETVIQEAVEVAEAEKIKFPDDFIRTCLRYLKKAGNHYPSLAVDLINNRPTEIDYFNGKIVEYGRKHYIRTSLNLAFTNMVKASSLKNLLHVQKTALSPGGIPASKSAGSNGSHFLGIDLGSAYTKIAVIDKEGNLVYKSILPTHNREKIALKHVFNALQEEFNIKYSCATGYGRKHFPDSDIIKTEINCAAAGFNLRFPGAKNIIDIGGEDIKVIRCDENGQVENFYLNDKCAAGTGSFLTEIAERAEIEISEMSRLARHSDSPHELNSFCTVFAKTEIMKWIFNGSPVEDLARAIYLSISNRVAKLRIDPAVPVYLIGGVIAYHPFLLTILENKLGQEIKTTEYPQYMVATGAATIALQKFGQLSETKKEVLNI